MILSEIVALRETAGPAGRALRGEIDTFGETDTPKLLSQNAATSFDNATHPFPYLAAERDEDIRRSRLPGRRLTQLYEHQPSGQICQAGQLRFSQTLRDSEHSDAWIHGRNAHDNSGTP